ncbi:MAG: hypothetical protein J0H60_13155 [Rhizobiales bacterium]|nr:hypothetical protein [Hyphomicrobiales bacterium]
MTTSGVEAAVARIDVMKPWLGEEEARAGKSSRPDEGAQGEEIVSARLDWFSHHVW